MRTIDNYCVLRLIRANNVFRRSDPFTLPNYKPDVMIVHRDAKGRELNEKEAFREMSHAFHGKVSP